MEVPAQSAGSTVRVFLDDATEPLAVYRPPAHVHIDTTTLSDGEHVLHVRATDAMGNEGRRAIPFVVANGPGITVNGLRPHERVSGSVEIEVNAFSADEPFDPVRAESGGPVPAWTWVMIVLIAAWAGWYALSEFNVPPSFAATPTYAANPVDLAAAPAGDQSTATNVSGKGSAGGFDYGATGGALFTQNCASCHGAAGAGVPGVFPSLVKNDVVTASDPAEHIRVVLRGLRGKAIGGVTYASQMPAFPQLNDQDIAAIVDHERTSWGNAAPTVTPDEVKKLR